MEREKARKIIGICIGVVVVAAIMIIIMIVQMGNIDALTKNNADEYAAKKASIEQVIGSQNAELDKMDKTISALESSKDAAEQKISKIDETLARYTTTAAATHN